MIPKITEKHIYLPKFGGKMKVNLAAQILSNTMSAALKTLIDQKLLNTDAEATRIFSQNINDLFDILNSNKIVNSYRFKNALRKNSDNIDKLIELSHWINELKIFNQKGEEKTKTFKCLNGWQQTINAIIILVNDYLDGNLNWLLTRNLCTDPLENFFGSVREAGGLNDKPD